MSGNSEPSTSTGGDESASDPASLQNDLFVRYVTATQLHGMYDFRHDFVPGVNVIYGRNGVGKSTLLHILANALPGHFEQFFHLQFGRIVIGLAGNREVGLTRKVSPEGNDFVEVELDGLQVGQVTLVRRIGGQLQPVYSEGKEKPVSRRVVTADKTAVPQYKVSYFPAFRSMVDAWESAKSGGPVSAIRRARSSTEFARELFGKFTPQVNYEPLPKIDADLEQQIGDAFREVAAAETAQMTQAAIAVYKGTLNGYEQESRSEAALVAGIVKHCGEIGNVSALLGRTSNTDLSALKKVVEGRGTEPALSGDSLAVLGLYHDALATVAEKQGQAVTKLRTYLEAVNRFLEESRMKLVVSPTGRAMIRHDGGGGREVQLNTLSSGGRQIVTLMYAATRLSDTSVVLIDEPELSLHVDWQRSLLGEMASLTGNTKQIIVATHSPEVSAELDDVHVKKFRASESPTPLAPDSFPSLSDEVTNSLPRESEEDL